MLAVFKDKADIGYLSKIFNKSHETHVLVLVISIISDFPNLSVELKV